MSTLIATDPQLSDQKLLKVYQEQLKMFQEARIIEETTLASVIYPDLYSVPMKWFNELKKTYQKEVQKIIEKNFKGHLNFIEAKVIISNSSHKEDVVGKLENFALAKGYELLVAFSQSRKGLPYWLLGSFSQTASLIARIPVLIIKANIKKKDFSSTPKFVVAVDISARIPSESLSWLMKVSRKSGAQIAFIYVRPIPVFITSRSTSPLDDKKSSALEKLKEKFEKNKTHVSVSILEEDKSIAQTIVDFAEKEKAWAIVSFNNPSRTFRKILMGPCTRQILSLTNRPFINLRMK